MVCTDVAARGIHVDNISLVLHVDPPQDHKSYLHRGGRTARAGEKGTVMTLVLPNERRSTDSMTRRAGIKPFRIKATPGHPRLEEVAGARTPIGEPIPVWEPSAPAAKQRQGRGGFGGNGGGRGPRRFRSERPAHGGEGQAPRERSFGDDSRSSGGGYRSERPAGGGYRSDRPAGGGYRSERPAGGYRGGERREPFRADRPAQSGGGYRSERPAGEREPFRNDRQGGGFRGGEFRADGRGSAPRSGGSRYGR